MVSRAGLNHGFTYKHKMGKVLSFLDFAVISLVSTQMHV